MADVRRDIQSLVIKLYFERLRLLSQSAGDEKQRQRILEIEAQLDALSGGAFADSLAEPITQGRSARGQAAAAP